MALDQWPEAPDRQLVAVNLGIGRHSRRTRGLVDQGHLSERVAGPELADLLAVNRHGHVTALDQDERPAGLALLGDRLAGRIGPLDELVGQPLEEGVISVCEERYAADQLAVRAGHGADPTTRTPSRSDRGRARASPGSPSSGRGGLRGRA